MAVEQPSNDEGPCSELTAFQTDALAIIAKLGRPHGLAIKDELSERHGKVFHGRLYPNLDTLVAEGLVEKGKQDDRTNWYEITEQGARELADYQYWLSDCLDDAYDDVIVTDGGVDLSERTRQPDCIYCCDDGRPCSACGDHDE